MATSRTLTVHQVRGLEMDATGTVPPFWVARYLEHARWETFTAEAVDHRADILSGVVRASAFAFAEPIRYGDILEIETWLARVGTTSFDFGHRVCRQRDDKEVASARATIVQLGPQGPTPVSGELRDLIQADPAPVADAWPETIDGDPFNREWVVRPSDQDSFQHVNQAMYIAFMDDTRTLASMEEHPAGAMGPIAKLSLEYRREVRAGDRVRMQLCVTGERMRACVLTHAKTGDVLSRGQLSCRES